MLKTIQVRIRFDVCCAINFQEHNLNFDARKKMIVCSNKKKIVGGLMHEMAVTSNHHNFNLDPFLIYCIMMSCKVMNEFVVSLNHFMT